MNLPDNMTYGETYGRAVEIALHGSKEEAEEWFAALVERNVRLTGVTRDQAEYVERTNIGYWAGYYDESARRAVASVYGAIHPIFGNDFAPSADKALEAGKRAAMGEFKE
jgi:hypothetical protein